MPRTLLPKLKPRGPSTAPSEDEEIRIVLVGRTGNGKSASGNTLLNRETFRSTLSPASVTCDCEKARGVVDGRKIAVIDTPGIFDTKFKEFEVLIKLKTCISMASPGPHAFLIVIKLDRFTEEEQRTVEILQQVFGDKADAYSMILFTYGDQLGNMTIEEFTLQSPKLTGLIQQCGNRYHVFNNKDPTSNQVQAKELLEKIEKMVSNNGGGYYTNKMFEEVEKTIREQAEKNLKASEKERLREKKALRGQLNGEELELKFKELEEKYKLKAREKAERKNKYISPKVILASTQIGLTVGAAFGVICGPIGIGIGAAAGGLVGVTVGLIAPAARAVIKNHCVTQ